MATANATATARPALSRVAFPLWGGEAVIATTDPARLGVAREQVDRVIDAFDVTCSSFRADSELSRLNASAGAAVPVSELLFEAIDRALEAARTTNGAVDPTVGRVLVAHRINPAVDGVDPAQISIEPVPGHTVVRLDRLHRTVTLPTRVRLDLGAAAKALAADMAASAAAAAARCGVLVGLCGDIAVAGDPPRDGWQIRVTDDHRDGAAPGQTVAIQSGGLATSSTTVRRRDTAAALPIHHLMDPRTGRPAEGPWRTATVTAATCLEANTASTAAIVLGAPAPEWLAANGLHARLVTGEGTVRLVGDWPSEGDDLQPSDRDLPQPPQDEC